MADILDVQLCGVLKLCEDDQNLEIVSNVGRTADLRAVVPAGTATHAGYALSVRGPVVSEDLRTESRFDGRPLLSRGVLSGMNAVSRALTTLRRAQCPHCAAPALRGG